MTKGWYGLVYAQTEMQLARPCLSDLYWDLGPDTHSADDAYVQMHPPREIPSVEWLWTTEPAYVVAGGVVLLFSYTHHHAHDLCGDQVTYVQINPYRDAFLRGRLRQVDSAFVHAGSYFSLPHHECGASLFAGGACVQMHLPCETPPAEWLQGAEPAFVYASSWDCPSHGVLTPLVRVSNCNGGHSYLEGYRDIGCQDWPRRVSFASGHVNVKHYGGCVVILDYMTMPCGTIRQGLSLSLLRRRWPTAMVSGDPSLAYGSTSYAV